MVHNVEFVAFWLFPKRHTNEPRLDEREVVRVKKELPKASAARAFVARRQDYPFPDNWLKAKQIHASNFAHVEQMPGVQERLERSG